MSEPSSAPSAPSIAPVLLKDLEFGDAEKKNDVLAKLISLARENPTFTSEHISARAAELLRILKLPQTQEHRTALVQFISALFYLTPASRALLAPHADAIVPYLVPCYTTECLHVQYALSRLAEDDPASHAASLRTHLYYAHPGPEVVRGAVEVYGYTIQNGYPELAKLFFRAGARHARCSQSPRRAAVICLRQVYPPMTRAVVRCLGDESDHVAFGAMSFCESVSVSAEEETRMRAELVRGPEARRALVLGRSRGAVWRRARIGCLLGW